MNAEQMAQMLGSNANKDVKAELFDEFIKESITPKPIKELFRLVDMDTKLAATISDYDNPVIIKEIFNVLINYGKL